MTISDLEADQMRPGLPSSTQELMERRNCTLSTVVEKVKRRLLVTVDFLYAGCTVSNHIFQCSVHILTIKQFQAWARFSLHKQGS